MGDEPQEAYERELLAWRAAQEDRLRAPGGWLSLLGLFWLKAGVNSLGSHRRSAIVLPEAAPAFVGELCLREGAVTLGVAGEGLLVNGAPPDGRPLAPDDARHPDQLTIGSLLLRLTRRGDQIGVLVHDTAHPRRAAFPGRRWHPPDPAYRIAGSFAPYAPPRPIVTESASGERLSLESPGAVLFTLEGRQLRLDCVAEPDGALSVSFRDLTSGATTAAAGRTLRLAALAGELVELDFNRAVSLPDAFTPFADSPLPPPQNQLPVAIPAGELA